MALPSGLPVASQSGKLTLSVRCCHCGHLRLNASSKCPSNWQAHLEVEELYKSHAEKLDFEVQSHKKALDESNQLRAQVQTELEKVKDHCNSCHASEHFFPVNDVTKP